MKDNSIKAMFSSATDMWATPQSFFDRYDRLYSFELDVCAVAENAKCKRFFSPEDDGLAQNWTGSCWMNPPYGRQIGHWMKKAATESKKNDALIVCLVPARTDTAWWHDWVIPHASTVEFVRGRIKFGGHMNSAPFPSAVVIYGKPIAAMEHLS
jgi:phage N-6-adenine-methyltransferase